MTLIEMRRARAEARQRENDLPDEARFEAPNMDCLDAQQLDDLSNVFGRLAAYADAKARAIRMRLKGDIECAISFEKGADERYMELPKWARW